MCKGAPFWSAILFVWNSHWNNTRVCPPPRNCIVLCGCSASLPEFRPTGILLAGGLAVCCYCIKVTFVISLNVISALDFIILVYIIRNYNWGFNCEISI